jgi:hypothetical protein
MTIYRGPGGTGTASSEVDTTEYQEFLVQAQAAKEAAEAARDAALAAETNAETAETNAELAETNAELAETNAEAASVTAIAAAESAQDWATKTSGPVAGGEYSAKYHALNAATSASEAAASAAVVNPANIVYNTNTYANPSWLTSLAWSKVTSTPTTVAGYGITNAYTKTEVDASLATKQAADTELTTLAGMSSNRATFLASNEGFGFRNRIINGDMRIDQRNAGAAVTANNANATVYPVDQWGARAVTPSTSGAFTVQQSSTVPTGFKNSLLATVSVAATPASTDQFFIQQRIEGFNIADFDLGTAAPITFTLSFWVRSSLTGLFGGSMGNNVNLSYPFSFTINAANTWEQKTVTIIGPTTGTWNTTNGVGLVVHFSLGAGSSHLGTANTWANYPVAPTGSINLISTSGATFYITGVQLEAGSVATQFERRDYGRELMMCQRYCVSLGVDGGTSNPGAGVWYSSTATIYQMRLPVEMRAAPVLTNVSPNLGMYGGGFSVNANAPTINTASPSSVEFYTPVSSGAGTAGQATSVRYISGKSLLTAEL